MPDPIRRIADLVLVLLAPLRPEPVPVRIRRDDGRAPGRGDRRL